MRKFKKLNRKGFTLIELLAVIFILAIVMGIAANSVLSSINNSRSSSLYSTAQNAANTLNTWVAEDMVLTDNNLKHLGDDFVSSSQIGTWICLGNSGISSISNAGSSATLLSVLGLNEKDIVIGTDYSGPNVTSGSEADPACSALKYNKGTNGYEILLVAKTGGKYYVSSDKLHFAYSNSAGPNTVSNSN